MHVHMSGYKIKPDNIADVEKLLTNAEYEAGL